MTRFARLSTLTLLVAILSSVAAPSLRAQPAPAEVPSVDSLFADASAKETAVRKALAADEPLPTLLKAVRTVVADYEAVVRHYPTSSFCDDALWRAAKLSRDAFEEFHEARERSTALRLLQLLASGYPSSRLARQVPEQVAWLNAHPARASAPATAAAPVPAAPPRSATAATLSVPTTKPSPPPAGPARPIAIKAVRRTVLKDAVRVVIELDAEVPFHDERIDNPNRVFIDLPSTRAAATLIDQTLRFDSDSDIVRQIRVGRQPNNTTRVVLEAAGVSSYSVYPLYSPYRLVIDCLRADSKPASASPAPLAIPPARKAAIDTHMLTSEPALASKPKREMAPSTPPTAPPAAPATNATPDAPKLNDVPVKTADVRTASDRPAWAVTLARPSPPPPPLMARRIRWVFPMPPDRSQPLESTGGSRPAAASTTDGASRTAKTAAAPAPSSTEPSKNVAGGLSIARQLGLGVSRIVIDPGHGGHDPGAQGPGISEADLVLDVALRLEKLLAKVPGVEVMLTRRENDFVPLQERTAMANREGADLFLSIHANASSVPAARGIETYFLNFAWNQNAAAVAARENATSDQTMGALQDVVKAIALNSKVDESRDFATYVQRQMLESLKDTNTAVRDLGVKQAPFVVLIGASMPSVLAEISFITNPQEARLLKSTSYRQRIAQALFDGIRKYQVALKNGTAVAQQQD